MILTVNKHVMSSMNFVINDKGERTALLIDLVQLKKGGRAESDVMQFMEDLEDTQAIELSKDEEKVQYWEDAKTRLRDKGIIGTGFSSEIYRLHAYVAKLDVMKYVAYFLGALGISILFLLLYGIVVDDGEFSSVFFLSGMLALFLPCLCLFLWARRLNMSAKIYRYEKKIFFILSFLYMAVIYLIVRESRQ